MAETKTRKRTNNTTFLWTAAGIALIVIFFGVRQLTREKLPLRVGVSQIQPLVKLSSTNGKVEPQSQFNFEAHAPAAGLVKQLYVHAGEHVEKGMLLLQVDDTDARAKLAAAAAALQGAEANLHAVESGGSQQELVTLTGNITKAKLDRDQAEKDLAAVQQLQAQGAAAPSEVAQAQQRLELANATLHSLEQQQKQPYAPLDLSHAKSAVAEAQAAYAAAAQVVEQSNVRAPFAGTVYSLPISRYEYVEPGALLLQMADLGKLQVRGYFDEPEIGDLRVGNPVTIEWNAKPGRKWYGHILRLPSTIITYGTRNVGEVPISVDNPDGTLLPNTNVTVTVTTQEVPNALTVPREALHVDNGRSYVYVVRGDTLHVVPVKLGALNLTAVQIISGLKDHETVALGTTNGAPLSEGVPIRIVD